MGRDITPNERPEVERDTAERQQPPREAALKPVASREREVAGRGRAVRVSDAERQTMEDIGKFRTVTDDDLQQFRYGGDAAQMRQDLRSLEAQGLVQRRTIWPGAKGERLAVLSLTRAGKDSLEHGRSGDVSQVLYAGFVKPAEVAHDAAIYRMYQAEASRIGQEGGQVRRVALDYELKRKVYSPMAKAKALGPLEYARRQAEVAQANHLKVVAGKIPLPDLRIEYETSAGEMARVDLELATHHYHGPQLASKAEAGFKMYAPEASVGRLSAVLDDHDIMAKILSL